MILAMDDADKWASMQPLVMPKALMLIGFPGRVLLLISAFWSRM